MGNAPYRTTLESLTNDVISSKELNFKFEGTNAKGKPINAYRVDKVQLIILAFAGIATGDYFIIEFDYANLNSKALADLKSLTSNDFIERVGHIYEILGTNGNIAESVDPAKIPLVFDFENCFITQAEAFMNVLAHGLAAPRDCEIILWGGYVHLPEKTKKKYDSGITL